MKCTFFGHRNIPDDMLPMLRLVIQTLIEERDITEFYIGNHGRYDRAVYTILKELKKTHPYIKYYVVYAYPPSKDQEDFEHSIYPEEVADGLAHYAIDRRNKWMVTHSDMAVVYVTHGWGGAAKYAKMAERKGLKVIRIDDIVVV